MHDSIWVLTNRTLRAGILGLFICKQCQLIWGTINRYQSHLFLDVWQREKKIYEMSSKKYSHWKQMMKHHIIVDDFQLWKIIQKGLLKLEVKNSKWELVPKPVKDFDEIDYWKVEKNAKAIKMLTCGLSPMEFNRVSSCDTTKEIWDKLHVTLKEHASL